MTTPVTPTAARSDPRPRRLLERTVMGDGTPLLVWDDGLVEVHGPGAVVRYLPCTYLQAVRAAARASLYGARAAYFAVHPPTYRQLRNYEQRARWERMCAPATRLDKETP